MRLTFLACLVLFGTMAPASAQDLADETFDCVMDPVDVIALGAPVTGILENVLVRRGERVTKGQPIARLESSVEEATVKLLRTRANSDEAILAQTARRDLIAVQRERIATLVDRNVASAEQLQEAEAELVAANALLAQAELEREIANQELARAEQQLDQRTIKSPIDGIILSRDLSGGEYVAANGSVVSIVQLDPLLIEAFLPVELYPAISNGQRAMIAPAAPFTDNYEAQVITFDQVFDAASGTFGIALELPNPGAKLPAGHRCILSFPDAG